MPAVHIIIKGKVQGVFFRASAKEMADKIGVSGKVRNTDGGEVEVWASGSGEQLERFLEWCRKGPSRARVTEVIEEAVPDEEFDGFVVVRS